MMNEEYIKRLDFDSDTFEAMKTDMNFILQRMIGSMIEKDSTEGSMTIKIDVNNVMVSWHKMSIQGQRVVLGEASIILPDCTIVGFEKLKEIELNYKG